MPQRPDDESQIRRGVHLHARYILTFFVGPVLALAPVLGRFNIPIVGPLFEPLSYLFPTVPFDPARGIYAIASTVTGFVAVSSLFYAERFAPRAHRRRVLGIAVGVGIASVLLLYSSHVRFVRIVPDRAEAGRSVSVLVAPARSAACGCQPGVSDLECLQDTLHADPAKVATCWGDIPLQRSLLSLALPYLVVLGCIGAAVSVFLARPQVP